jgi:AcrR family transcriptional regulator
MADGRRANRGPSAAANNRAALIAAAREIFGTVGFDAPLSLIARTAEVGQGSLYRHFPDRESLVLAVFQENIRGLESFAAQQDSTLDDILSVVIEQVTDVIACIPMLNPQLNPNNPKLAALNDRITTVFATKLDAAQACGRIRRDITVDDLMLALAMFATLLSHADADARPQVAQRAWRLLLGGLHG